MSIIAEALKKAQRKGKKGGDVPPPFELGKDKDKGKAPVRGAGPSRAPRAKPVSAASAAEAVKSLVGARKPAAAKPSAAKTTPKAAPAKQQKTASRAGKKPLLQQRKVRVAVMAVSVMVGFAALMYYVNYVHQPGVDGMKITSAPVSPATAQPRQAAVSQPTGEVPAGQAEGGEEPAGEEQAAGELAVPPVPELEQLSRSPLAGMDEPQEPETDVSPESQLGQAAAAEPLAAERGIAVSGTSTPPAGAVPPSIINKGEQEKTLREDIYHFNMAVYFQRKGAVREALDEYEEVIRLSPHNAEVYSNMGVLYNQIGEFGEAVAVLQKALLIDPRYSKARNNLAVAYYRAGQYEQALEQAGQAIENEPGNLDALNNMGLIYRKMDRPELAEQSFRQALAVDTGYSAAHYNLALLFEQTGQLAQAVRHYRSFLAAGEGSEQLNAKVRARLRDLSPG